MTDPLIELAAEPRLDRRTRKLIRLGLAQRAAELGRYTPDNERTFERDMSTYPLGGTDHANRQHYEVPPSFFKAVLGPHLKYSCCWWENGEPDLGAAERAMLDCVIARAQIAPGQRVLDLGCGWGALSLELARRFPSVDITALSGSAEQRRFIEERRDQAGCRNLDVVTSDIGDWQPKGRFDRILSVEMFEHIRNWPALTRRLSEWLNQDALLFVHVFCHARASYFFENDVTAKFFFTGGMMPAVDLLPRYCSDLQLSGQWTIPGTHYQRTAEAWLSNLDARSTQALEGLALGRDPRPVGEQLAAWRLFFMITAESFGFDAGQSWIVAHYLLRKP